MFFGISISDVASEVLAAWPNYWRNTLRFKMCQTQRHLLTGSLINSESDLLFHSINFNSLQLVICDFYLLVVGLMYYLIVFFSDFYFLYSWGC